MKLRLKRVKGYLITVLLEKNAKILKTQFFLRILFELSMQHYLSYVIFHATNLLCFAEGVQMFVTS